MSSITPTPAELQHALGEVTERLDHLQRQVHQDRADLAALAEKFHDHLTGTCYAGELAREDLVEFLRYLTEREQQDSIRTRVDIDDVRF